MNILDQISEKEYATIDYWRLTNNKIHDDNDFIPSRQLLNKIWADEKQKLFELFGNKLILSKEINVSLSEEELIYRNEEECSWSELDFTRKLFSRLEELYYHDDEFKTAIGIEEREVYVYLRPIRFLFTAKTLVTNKYIGDNIRFHVTASKAIPLQYGTKVTTILKMFAKELNLLEEYEEFRLWHSRVLNNKAIKGTLKLSIHPLDYMTMSDNGYNWNSCMSWSQDGCYKAGTIEMMNSPYVVVAYIDGTKPYKLSNNYSWSNKKWRCLYIVDPDSCIVSVKPYPYEHEGLDKICMDWLKELCEQKYNTNYLPVNRIDTPDGTLLGVPFDFETCYMYNDFGARKNGHYIYINEEAQNCIITYSGEWQCMCCGGTDWHDISESHLICRKCNYDNYCEHCGEPIDPEGSFWCERTSSYICPECRDELGYVYCSFCSEYTINQNIVYILKQKTNLCIGVLKNMCDQCIDYWIDANTFHTTSDKRIYSYLNDLPVYLNGFETLSPKEKYQFDF